MHSSHALAVVLTWQDYFAPKHPNRLESKIWLHRCGLCRNNKVSDRLSRTYLFEELRGLSKADMCTSNESKGKYRWTP